MKKRERGLDTGWQEASGHPDTCCHGLVAVSCHLSGCVQIEHNGFALTRRCFLFFCVNSLLGIKRVFRSVFLSYQAP